MASIKPSLVFFDNTAVIKSLYRMKSRCKELTGKRMAMDREVDIHKPGDREKWNRLNDELGNSLGEYFIARRLAEEWGLLSEKEIDEIVMEDSDGI